MKAYLIDAQNKTVENVDVENMDDIVKMIGYDTIESDKKDGCCHPPKLGTSECCYRDVNTL